MNAPRATGPRRADSARKLFEDQMNAEEPDSDVLEVWFAGVHTGTPFISLFSQRE